MNKRSGRLYMNAYDGTARKAGAGIYEDDYSEDSGMKNYEQPRKKVRMPSDFMTEEERAALNGEMIIIRGKRE